MTAPNIDLSVATTWYQSRRFLVKNHPGNGVDSANVPVRADETSRDFRAVASTSTPSFEQLKRQKRLLPENNHSLSVLKFSAPPGSYVRQLSYKGLLYPSHGPVIFEETFSSISAVPMGVVPTFILEMNPSDAYQKAYAQVMNKISLTKSQAVVSIAEIGKTGTMIAHSATRIYNAVKALKRGQLGTFAASFGIVLPRKQTTIWYRDVARYRRGSFHKSEFVFSKHPVRTSRQFRQVKDVHVNNLNDFLAKTWLEYSYGWIPLLKDLHGVAEAAASVITKQGFHMKTVSGVGSTLSEAKKKGPNGDKTLFLDRSETVKTSVRIVLRYRLSEPISVANAFGLTNPLAVAWELVPFSFVVDWFLPIGRALESITAFQGLSFMGGAVTTKTQKVLRASVREGIPLVTQSSEGPTTLTSLPFKLALTSDYFSLSRVKLDAWPAYGAVRFKSPSSVSHAITSISLLQSLFIGKAR